MGGMFSTGKPTTITNPFGWIQNGGQPAAPIIPPPAPTLDNSAAALDVAAQQQAVSLQRGRSATMLTGGAGLNNLGSSSKVLLGQ